MVEEIRRVRAEIFRLAKQALDLETMHWYMWLDECFENDEFHAEDFKNTAWRCLVLRDKGEPVYHLLNLITRVLCQAGCIDDRGRPLTRVEAGDA